MREIGRSRPAPQGICVANPAGKVLAWALSFEDKASVPRFLDYALARYREYPDATKPVPAQRFMRFPGHAGPAAPDTGAALPAVRAHGKKADCPSAPRRAPGTLVARVVGRAVKADGTLAGECQMQENYAEDLFDLPPDAQAEIARAVGAGGRVRLPAPLERLIASYAYLGQLDVRPVASPVPDSRSVEHALEFWLEPGVTAKGGVRRLRLTGRSDVEVSNPDRRGDGASFLHRVTLQWQGFLTLDGDRVKEVLLYAQGRERLRWNNPTFTRAGHQEDVARLPAGRPLDVDTAVRYGVVGTR